MIKLLGLFAALSVYAGPLDYGTFTARDRHSQEVLAAPHGGFDLDSDAVALAVAEKLGWSVVAANGFRQREHPFNVNRPTEGIGLSSDKELHTADSQTVYAAFHEQVLRLRKQPSLYVEIHGEGKTDRIEVANVGLTSAQAGQVKAALTAAFGTDIEVGVEGVDKIFFLAGGAKKFGLLGTMKHALHIELPKRLRIEQKDRTVKALAEALSRISRQLSL